MQSRQGTPWSGRSREAIRRTSELQDHPKPRRSLGDHVCEIALGAAEGRPVHSLRRATTGMKRDFGHSISFPITSSGAEQAAREMTWRGAVPSDMLSA